MAALSGLSGRRHLWVSLGQMKASPDKNRGITRAGRVERQEWLTNRSFLFAQ